MIRDLVDICPDAESWCGNGSPSHDCWTDAQDARVNTDCDHPLRTTDPACTGCALRDCEGIALSETTPANE